MSLVGNRDSMLCKDIIQHIEIQQHHGQVKYAVFPNERPDGSVQLGDDFPVIPGVIVNGKFSWELHGGCRFVFAQV